MVVVAVSSLARIWGECSTVHSPPVLFVVVVVVVVVEAEISSLTLIPHFRPGSVHSGSAILDDCDRVFPDKLRGSSFPHYAWTAA